MKRLLIWMLLMLPQLALYAQPPCGSSPAAGNTCATATPICDLNGYCGNTSASYSANYWSSSCGFLGLFDCGLSGEFCGSIENNSFLTFTASATTISFDVWVFNSLYGDGIQIMIFSANNCSGDVTSYYCDQLTPSSGSQTVSASGLTVGNTYYIMIDGFAGDVCDYVFAANTGVATPVDVTPSNTTVCAGGTVQLTANGGNGTYTWNASPDLNTTSGAVVTVTVPATPGTYTYTVNSNIGTSLCPNAGTADAVIVVGSAPDVEAGTGSTISCSTPTVSLNGSSAFAGGTISWSGPGIVSGGNTFTPSVNQAGTYTLTITDPLSGCQNTDVVSVSENTSVPNADAGIDVGLSCSASTAVLNGSSATPGATFSWSGPGIVSGGNTASPTVDQAGTYTITVTDPSNGCTSTDVVNVAQNASPPDAEAGATQEINCTTTSVVLNGSSATPGATFSWSGPGIVSGGSTATPTANTAGNYTITVTDPSNGCTSTDVVTVTENTALPNASAGNGMTITCTAPSVVLNGSSSTPGVTFSWSGAGIVSGGNTASPTVNQAGNYTITVTDPANGCTSTDVVAVAENTTLPNANAGSDLTITCTSPSVVLSGTSTTAGVTYSWSGPGIVSGGSTATPTANQPGNYTMTVTNPANGCTSTDMAVITENTTPPNVNAGADMLITCASTSVVLNGSSTTPGVSYSWTGPGIVSGGSTATPTVNQAGNYTLTVTNPANGCTSTDVTTVNSNAVFPPVAFSGDVLTGCESLDVTFTGVSDPGLQYSWDFGDGSTDNGSLVVTHNYTGTGCYDVTLTVTNPANGCSDSQLISSYICLVPSPTAAFTVTPGIGCAPLEITMINQSEDATVYNWSISSIGNQQTFDLSPLTVVINESVDIDLEAVNDLGCTSSTSYSVILSTCGCTDPTALNYNSAANLDDGSCEYLPIGITIPNVFTPNNDGLNDYFELSPKFISNLSLVITNRWGNVVFNESGLDPKWDGTVHSAPAEEGSYFFKYSATGVGGEVFEGHGFLNLIRD